MDTKSFEQRLLGHFPDLRTNHRPLRLEGSAPQHPGERSPEHPLGVLSDVEEGLLVTDRPSRPRDADIYRLEAAGRGEKICGFL